MKWILSATAYVVLAPLVGGLASGLDRIFTARMQRRKGPPLLQPFYDVAKLLQKQQTLVDRSQLFFVSCFLLFMVLSGVLFFSGLDLLLVFFTLTLASVFLVLAAYASGSPFSFIGAERELIQIVAYEPMIILAIVGFYIVTGSFHVRVIAAGEGLPAILFLPGCFLGLVMVLLVKFQKSPFDLSSSHHAHQEIVKGVTSDFSGRVLAIVHIAHWYEYTLLFALMYLFFSSMPVVGLIVAFLMIEVLVLLDNVFARFSYTYLVKSLWIFTLILGFGNIAIVYFLFNYSPAFRSFF